MDGFPECIRVFVAVRIPESVVGQLTQLQEQLRIEFPHDVSWTRPAAMHLTLQFLGNLESARLPRLKDALFEAAQNFRPFEIALGQPGCFGNRVLWIGLRSGEELLRKLANAVGCATHGFGSHTEEREFNAHVTLGRVKKPLRGVMAALRRIQRPEGLCWVVRDFELIRSELSPRGAAYTVIQNFLLLS